MSAYRSSKKHRFSYFLLIVMTVLVLSVTFFCCQLAVHIDEISRYESKFLAVKIINSAVETVINNISPDELIKENLSESGEIASLSLDPKNTNMINYILSDTISSKLKEYENEGFSVSIGTLSGITFLNGRGFDIDIRLQQLGAVTTHIRSEFVSCAVNQSKYRVYVDIKVELRAVLPISSTDVSVEQEYLIGEKVIVGKVPNTYFSA